MANLIGNPGFETDTTGWSASGGGTIARVTDVFHDGVASALRDVTAVNNSADYQAVSGISAATRYFMEGYIRPSADGSFGPGSNDGNPGFLQNFQSTYLGLLTGNWYRVILLWTTHASATVTSPHFATRSAANDFHLDDAFLDLASGYEGAYAAAVIADSPALYWRMAGPDLASLCADCSSNTRTARRGFVGTDTGFTLTSPIVYGTDDYIDNSACIFDSPTTGSFLNLANSTPISYGTTANYSVELWFEPTTVDTTVRRLLGFSNDETAGSNAYSITYDSTNGITARRRVAGTDHTVSYLPSDWNQTFHAVLVYDGTNVNLWVNGVHRGQTASGTTTAPSGGFMVGQGQTQANGAKATIDEVAIYASALSQSRIEAHYAAGSFPAVGPEFKRFVGPLQLSGSATTLYTCPTGKRARILHIHASNPSASEVDLNLSIGTDAAATRVYDDLPLAADQIEHNYDPYDLAAGEIIQGWASTAGTVVLTITGYEVSA